MKKSLYLLSICVLLIILFMQIAQVQATPNVAKLYCDKLNADFGNYGYQILEEDAGQRGLCTLPSNQQVDAWDFFIGKVAVEFSYCTQKGYLSETQAGGIFSSDEQVCLVPQLRFLPVKRVPVVEVAGLDYKEYTVGAIPSLPGEGMPKPSGGNPPEYKYKDFSNWDWRNPPESTKWGKNNYPFFDEINGWLTSIKDQSSCKACWSFGTMASIESRYKINSDDSMLDPDLSEQYIVSDCCKACGDCNGGSRYASFDYIVQYGISDEYCFEYRDSDSGCVPCADQFSRLWKIDNYVVTQYSGVNDLKQKIIDNGPVTIIMDWGGSFDENCIYKCGKNKKDEGTHIVVLAGYNETGDPSIGYWITKNSFGLGWPGRKCNIGEGYFKLGFDTCNVGAVIYSENVIPPKNFKPTVVLNSPENGFLGKDPVVNFGFTVYTKIPGNRAKCYLIVDGVERKNITVNDANPSTISDRLGIGKHSWKMECWEQKVGIKNTSETRTFELKFQYNDENRSTFVYLTEPYDNFSSTGNVTLKCEAYDSRKINNLSLYINVSGWTLIITNNLCEQNCFLEYFGFFETGSYDWNCLVDGSKITWARENFTFDILNEPGYKKPDSNESGSNDSGFINGSGFGSGFGFGIDFRSSLGACQKSSKRCWSTSVLQQCIDGKWGNLQFCAYGCDPFLLRCRSCREGERKCSEDGSNVLVCSNGSWKTQLCGLGCDGSECISGSEEINERGLSGSFYFIFGIILLVILCVIIIIFLARRRNNRYLDRNNKLMDAIKNEI